MQIKGEFKAHREHINDVLEITNSNYMATCSLDGCVRVWTLDDFTLKTELRDMNVKKSDIKQPIVGKNTVKSFIDAVTSMSYCGDYGGFLVSCGYTNYVNVWSPDTSLSKAFIGKLDGHTGTVVTCKIFPNSPNCVSVDDRFNVRIWELRNLNCIQLIRNEP